MGYAHCLEAVNHFFLYLKFRNLTMIFLKAFCSNTELASNLAMPFEAVA